MSHCSFQNTLADLRDCYDAMDDDVGTEEKRARRHLIQLCERIAMEFGDMEARLNEAYAEGRRDEAEARDEPPFDDALLDAIEREHCGNAETSHE